MAGTTDSIDKRGMETHILKKCFAIGLSIIGIVSPFILLRYGVFAGDEQYQILNAMNDTGNAVAPLSSFLTRIWGQMFGFSLLSMRTLAACLSTATVLIGAYYYQKRKNNKWNALMVTGICLFLSSTYQVFSYAIGWDVFSNLFTVATLVCLLRYLDTDGKSMGRVAMIGVFAALATASRLPSVVILPLSAGMLFFSRRSSTAKITHFILLISVFVVVILTTLLLIFGSVDGFVGECSDFLRSGMGDDHGSVKLWLLDTFNEIATARIPEISVMVMFILTFRFADRHHWNKTAVAATMLFFVTILIFIYHGHKYLAVVDNLFIVALTFTLALVAIYQNVTGRDAIIVIVACLAFAFVPVTLSNVRTTKILAAPLLPVILSFVTFNRPVRRFIAVAFIFGVIFWCRTKYLYGWFDRGLGFTRTELTIPNLSGIYTTDERARQFNEIYTSASQIDGDFIVAGRGRFLVEYTVGNANTDTRHFFYTSLNDKKYVDAVISQLDARPVTVMVIDAENFTAIPTVDTPPLEINGNSLMERQLRQRGFTLTKRGEYFCVYEPR